MARQSFSEKFFSPLAVASYLALGAVWYSNSSLFGNSPGQGPWSDVAMVGFLIGWFWFLADESEGISTKVLVVLIFITLCTFWLIGMGRSGSSPILLILLLAQYALRFSWRFSVIALIALNLIYLLILLTIWNAGIASALVSLTAFGSFQMFALLVLRYGQKAERMADELRLVNADLMATRTLLADSARDQERLRLSRELHDVAGHKLTALKMNLRAIRNQAQNDNSRALETADELAGELLDDLRAVVRQLRSGDGLSLEQGIRQLAGPLRGLDLHLQMDEEVRIERVIEAETFMRIAQEGLTNAVRHGRATEAWLSITKDNGWWSMCLDDNGRVRWPLQPGMGIEGMRERVSSLDGDLSLDKSGRGGLRLLARLPAERQL